MNNKLNETVLARILSVLPENIKPVNFFMDILDLGKESAYRRLRGEKVLSFEEVYKLCLVLRISLNEIVGDDENSNLALEESVAPRQGAEKKLLEFLHYYEDFLNQQVSSENSEIICTINYLLNTMLMGSENLFQFVYYRWIHQATEVPLNYLFADFKVPPEIEEVNDRIHVLHQHVKKVTFIIDRDVFASLIREIQYFYKRNLINNKELNMLKEELLHYLDTLECIFKKGMDENGTKFIIYLSLFDINCATSYAIWDDKEEVGFWHYYGYPIFTRDRGIAKRHKDWITSLKKYTSVISQSNEILQADFFNKQRDYVNRMADVIML